MNDKLGPNKKRTQYWLKHDLEGLEKVKSYLKEFFKVLKESISEDCVTIYKHNDEYTGKKMNFPDSKTCASNQKYFSQILKEAASYRCPDSKKDPTPDMKGILAEMFVYCLLKKSFSDFYQHLKKGIEESRDEFDLTFSKQPIEVKGRAIDAVGYSFNAPMVEKKNKIVPAWVIGIKIEGLHEKNNAHVGKNIITIRLDIISNFQALLDSDKNVSRYKAEGKGRFNSSQYGGYLLYVEPLEKVEKPNPEEQEFINKFKTKTKINNVPHVASGGKNKSKRGMT